MEQESIDELKAEVIRLKKAGNWVKCIALCREAVGLTTPSELPEWYWAKSNLSLALSNADTSQRPQNIEEAILVDKEILKQLPGKVDAFRWANTHRHLGFTYDLRSEGNKTENVEQMIEHMTQALTVFTREKYPEDWAITKGALAVAYSARNVGEPAENLRLAIQHLEDSMSVLNKERFPEDQSEAEEQLKSLRERLGAIKK